jgi:hypothetical protein
MQIQRGNHIRLFLTIAAHHGHPSRHPRKHNNPVSASMSILYAIMLYDARCLRVSSEELSSLHDSFHALQLRTSYKRESL